MNNIEEENKSSRLWLIIFCAFMVVLPFFVTTLVYFFQGQEEPRSYFYFLEIFLLVSGALTLFFMLIRVFFRDRVNWRKNKSVHEDRTTKEFRHYRINQYILAGVGVTLILLSLIAFFLR